jgi:serine/threonine-protein kinase RsbW
VEWQELTIAADVQELATVRRFVEASAAAYRCDPSVVDDMVLAVDEAVTNSIVHGYKGQQHAIEVAVGVDHNALVVRVRDWAAPFDPTKATLPDTSLPFARRPLGGMGIHMMRQLVDTLTYHRTPDAANELILTKRILP